MFVTPTIRQAPATKPNVFAFHIVGEVTSDDMEAMGAFMNDQFKLHDSVSMLLIFDLYDGAVAGASLNWESIKSRFQSLTKVERYGVVGAPGGPSQAVEWLGKILPVDARTFERSELDAAWAFVGAQPA